MSRLDELLEKNEAWASRIEAEDPAFFKRLAAIQTPKFLWIGCSDSRVPANQIVDMAPGRCSSIATSPMSWCTPTSTACR